MVDDIVCKKCNEIKPLAMFYIRKSGNPYSSSCKQCHCSITVRNMQAKGSAFQRNKTKKWRTNNFLADKALRCNERAKKLGRNLFVLTKNNIENMISDCGGICKYCLSDISGSFEIDHIMPYSLGGYHELSNLQLICRACNLKKNRHHPRKFLKNLWRENCTSITQMI